MISTKHALAMCESLADQLVPATDNEFTYMVCERYGELRLLLSLDGIRHYTYKPEAVRNWLDNPAIGSAHEQLAAFTSMAEPVGPITFTGPT
jgi:hypothetical protein